MSDLHTNQVTHRNSKGFWRLGFLLPRANAGHSENASIAAWLIKLRWVALAAQVVAGFVGFKYVFLEPLLIYPFFGTVFFLAIFNGVSVVELRNRPAPTDRFLFGQVAVDTITLTFLLALSGGTKNPFVALLFIHATIGALLFADDYRRGFVVLLLGCLLSLFAARDWQILSSDIYVWEWVPLFSLFVSLFVSWRLVASLSDTLRVTRQNLLQAKSREERIHHLLALGALTAEFAHEFATPLNTLRLRVARLKRNEALSGAEADLKAISETLDRSEKALREMTTAPLDSTMLSFEEVPISEFVARALQEWRSGNPSATVVLRDLTPGRHLCRIPTKVFAKSLSNLLDNAAAANADNIEVEVSEDAERLYLSVMDRGPGWPAQIKEQGIRPHLTTRPGGTGLGLFNCQSLCEVMGGSMEILDRTGGGAIAKLALPKTA